jgi:hypothetical protein
MERLFGILQDRLIVELRLAGITTTQRPMSSSSLSSNASTADFRFLPESLTKPGEKSQKNLIWIGSLAFPTTASSVMIIRLAWEDSLLISLLGLKEDHMRKKRWRSDCFSMDPGESIIEIN